MLAVVIPTLDDEERLAATLAALVPAAAEGVVREVVVVDGGSRDQTRRIADATGCTIVEAAGPPGAMLARGAEAVTRGEFLLFLRPGVVLDPRWEIEAAAFAERAARAGVADRRAAVFAHEIDEIGLGPRLRHRLAWLAGRMSGLPHPDQPLMMSRRLYRSLGGHRPLGALEDIDLVRRIGRSRVVRLRAAGAVIAASRQTDRPGVPARIRRALARGLAALPLPPALLVRLHG